MSDMTSTSDESGTAPVVEGSSLEPTEATRHAVKTSSQAWSICRRLIDDWKTGIANQKAITAQMNGQRPRDPAMLTALGRDWLPNLNSGILRVESGKVPARLWLPLVDAVSLTAARLGAERPMAQYKSQLFQATITSAIRSWRKWPWFLRQLARETGVFGFGFAVWFDPYSWKPTFVRQDRGFVPTGTDILDENWPLFVVRYAYKVHELLALVQGAEGAGSGWNKGGVARAIRAASPVPVSGDFEDERAYEELIRQASLGATYEKGFNVIETLHLFSTDPDGTVSHHILLESEAMGWDAGASDAGFGADSGKAGFLFEKRGRFKSMGDVVVATYFDPDDGSVQGSWGAGQAMFDLSLEAEKSLNDWIASNKQVAKIKVQTGAGKNPDEVKLVVDDAMMILHNGVFAGNTAAVTTDPRPFEALREALSQMAREKIGSLIPPVPLQPRDIKAAQINAKAAEQGELREQTFQGWLWQIALVIEQMARRLCDPESPEAEAVGVRRILEEKMDREEIDELTHQNQIVTISEFTSEAALRRAAFAASKTGSPYYNQKRLEELQAVAVGGFDFAGSVLLPGEDETVERMARRQQQTETAAMIVTGRIMDVLPMDADWFHMLELRPVLEQALTGAMAPEVAGMLLKHYEAHYVGAVAKRAIPKDRINVEKSFISKANSTLVTGRIPKGGFEDRIDPIDEAQAMMAGRNRISREGIALDQPVLAEAAVADDEL